MSATRTIPWQPFGEKHKEYIQQVNGMINAALVKGEEVPPAFAVAEGAIRSGKTIDHCILACCYLEVCRDPIHLASGSTIPNAKLNLGVCNGYGLEKLFRGRCRWGKFRDNPALFIKTQTGEKILVFAGAAKADSYKRILGNSFGLWIATEIDQHYDCDDSRESFVRVAMGRQAAAYWPLTLWDLNPNPPGHRIYRDYIDKYRHAEMPGYLYRHFTMRDNLSISAKRREEIEAMYEPGSVWHRRDILGERVAAEGLVYRLFADAPEVYRALPAPPGAEPAYDFIQVGVDFGGNHSAFAFVATGLKRDYSMLTALCSERHEAKGVDPDRMYQLLELFLVRVVAQYGDVAVIYADSAEQTLINGMRGRLAIPVRNSVKNRILDRVRATNILLATKRFYITEDCQCLAAALAAARYDPKAEVDTRLDDGTSDIDTLDAFEYSWERYLVGYTKYDSRGE